MISTNNPQEIVDGNNKFAFKLYHQMQGGTNTRKFNLCSSIMYGD
jgi:serine protease inhibitor